MSFTKGLTLILVVIPIICLILLLHQLYKYQSKKRIAKLNGDEALYQGIDKKRQTFTKRGALALLMVLAIVITTSAISLMFLQFNIVGYWLLQTITFLLALLYVLYRIFRVYVIAYNFRFYHISNHVAFLKFYLFVFIALIVHLIYAYIAAYYNLVLANAMFILLSCFFIIYYALACSLKYYFVLGVFKEQEAELKGEKDGEPLLSIKAYLYNSVVIHKKNRVHLLPLSEQRRFANQRRRIASIITLLFIILCIVSYNVETRVHELEIFNNDQTVCDAKQTDDDVVSLQDFKLRLLQNVPVNQNILLVTAHGGGLKANIWTMKVLNSLQKESEGRFFETTAALSGASGGMMGLSLYSVLSGSHPGDYETIGSKIDAVAYQNFASRDIAMTFGFDFIRKFAPLHLIANYRDRSYFAMVQYRNILESKNEKQLPSIGFRTYWKQNIFNKHDNYFPSLIVNSAKTNGKRGVFYTLEYEDTIFHNSDNLSQLNDGDIAFYEAVSSTNRFPALSPAAKIKGYGHYIDAGAIDNSGLLSALDLYTYLQKDTNFQQRKTAFIEILNGRNNYIDYLIRMFKKNYKSKLYPDHLLIEEIEQDNIVADIKTGLNLDKIPNYLNDRFQHWEKDSMITHVPIYLPFKISIDDVENYIGGAITCEPLRTDLREFLKVNNVQLTKDLKDSDPDKWITYEPTLARHLSESTITYYDNVLNGKIMRDQFNEVLRLLQ